MRPTDDGSFLWFDGVMVVDNGGAHGVVRKCGLVKGVKVNANCLRAECVTWKMADVDSFVSDSSCASTVCCERQG